MLSTNQRAGLVQATNGKARLAVSSTTNYRTHYFDLCGQGSKQTFTLRWFVARLASIATEGHFELWGGQGGIIANYFVCLLYLPSKGFRLTAWLQITSYNKLTINTIKLAALKRNNEKHIHSTQGLKITETYVPENFSWALLQKNSSHQDQVKEFSGPNFMHYWSHHNAPSSSHHWSCWLSHSTRFRRVAIGAFRVRTETDKGRGDACNEHPKCCSIVLRESQHSMYYAAIPM